MNTMISRNGTNALITRVSFQLMEIDITNAAITATTSCMNFAILTPIPSSYLYISLCSVKL